MGGKQPEKKTEAKTEEKQTISSKDVGKASDLGLTAAAKAEAKTGAETKNEKAIEKTEGKTNEKAIKAAAPIETPKKPTPSELLAEKAYKVMQKLHKNGIKEFTSTLLRDKLKLDKENGRNQIRAAMKRLEAAGKVEIKQRAVKEKGARKRYVYRLKEQ